MYIYIYNMGADASAESLDAVYLDTDGSLNHPRDRQVTIIHIYMNANHVEYTI